jgi:hypothetical protein
VQLVRWNFLIFAIASPRRQTPLPWYRRPHPLHQVAKNALWFRPLVPSLGETPFEVAQPEADVLAEPDARDSPGALLGPDPRFGDAEALGKLARSQEIAGIARAFAVVLATVAGDASAKSRAERNARTQAI